MGKHEQAKLSAIDAGAWEGMLSALAAGARTAGVFAEVRVAGGRLTCPALRAAAAAEYRVDLEGDKVWVSLVTPDRWLSESIEADLMNTGDDLRELIEEELSEQGYEGPAPPYQHYRSDDKLFTFRTAVPIAADEIGTEEAARVAARFLLAYEACFRRLGNMEGAGE